MLSITIDLNSATWGELRRFVASGVSLDDQEELALFRDLQEDVVGLINYHPEVG